jgi:hypothetical protein
VDLELQQPTQQHKVSMLVQVVFKEVPDFQDLNHTIFQTNKMLISLMEEHKDLIMVKELEVHHTQ